MPPVLCSESVELVVGVSMLAPLLEAEPSGEAATTFSMSDSAAAPVMEALFSELTWDELASAAEYAWLGVA